jgi:metal-responsive CopG/Arc/MetJ family transcriptional regulator
MSRRKLAEELKRKHLSATIKPDLYRELDALTRDGNPTRSQAVENAIADYMPKLRKLKKK